MAKKQTKVVADVVQAQCFVLVDKQGKTKAELSTGEYGTIIHLLDEKGRPQLTLQVNSQGNPSIVLFDDQNVPGVSIAITNRKSRGMTIQGLDAGMIDLGISEVGIDPMGEQPNIMIIDEKSSRTWLAMTPVES